MTGKRASCICTSLLCCAIAISWATQRAVADVQSDLQALDSEIQKKAEYIGENFPAKEVEVAIDLLGTADTEALFDYLNAAYISPGAPRGSMPNDTCATAEALIIGGGTVVTDNTGSTTEVIPSGTCTTSTPFYGLWYTVVGDGTTLTVSTCFPGTTFDTKVQVFCDCFDYVCIGGNDDASPSDIPNCGVAGLNRKSRFSWCSAAGQTYYIHVGGFSATTFGTIEIGVTSNGTACTTATSCTPPVRRCCYVDMGSNACADLTAGACAAVSGAWGSSGQTCATACPTGRCCYNDNGTSACATFILQSQCDALSGIWTASSSCTTACPTGRCCYLNAGTPDCVDAVNEAVCRDLAGSWFVGQTCAARPCQVNEYCGTALDVSSLLPYAASPSVSGAGGSFKPAAQSGCNSTTARNMQNDLWYTYTPTADCALAFHADTPSYDSVYAVYTGADCNSLTQVACADAEPHDFAVNAVAGTTYWFQVGKWGTSTTPPTNGTTNITINCVVGGACCLPDGSCQSVAGQAVCDTLSGHYDGDGSDCVLPCSGACCHSDGSCSDELTEAACDTAGGTFQGRGTLCATTNCPQPPPSNDDCAGAIAVNCGDVVNGNLASATNNYDPTSAGCTGFAAVGADVVYSLTVTQDQVVNLLYDPSPEFDASLYVVTDCNNLLGTCVAGADDNVTSPGDESLSFNAVANTTYYIICDKFGSAAGGPFTLSITCSSSLGRCCYSLFGVLEECANTNEADCVTLGGSFEGTWTAGTDCNDPCPTGSCCYGDGSCAVSTEDLCNDNLGSWTAGGVCEPNTCPMPPANDTCETAIAVSCGDSINGTNALANDDYTFTDLGCSGFDSEGPDVVYSFSTPVARDVTITMDPDTADLGLYVVTDCLNAEASCVAGDDSDGAGTAESVTITAAANTTYYIIVDTFSLSGAPGGSFTLTIDCPIGECGSCPADMDGNGRFNGSDIQAFTDCVVGAVNGIPGSGCACADMNNDQLVDLNDVSLFAAALTDINNKLCPPGAGRCCIAGGTVCDDTLTLYECDAAGGTFTAGETCANACPQLADDCDDVVGAQMVPTTLIGDNTLATDDLAPPACIVSTPNQGVWFNILGTGNTITLSTCNAATDFDTMLEVFCGECASPFCVAGNDDATPDDVNCHLSTGTVNRKSRVTFCSIAGQIYHIRVSGFGTTFGPFQVDVTDDGIPCIPTQTCVPPTGACCVGNVCSVGTAGDCTNLGGVYLGNGTDCTGNPCATGACCHPDGSCTQEASAAACTTAGGTSFAGISVSCAAANCPQPGQPGETCAVATVIPSLPFSTSFNNDLSTADGPPGSCNSGSATNMQNAVWYKYTPAADCTLVLNINPTNYDGIALVHQGPDCNSLTTLSPCLDEPEPMSGTFPATAGTTYWFQVGDWGVSEGGGPTDFSLDCVVGGACCHANGTCSDVAGAGDCIALGDVYRGDATSCASTICGGACCHPDGSCTDEFTETACLNAGGNYEGDGTTCATTNCPQPPPVNDECTGALAAVDGANPINLSAATDSLLVEAVCDFPFGDDDCHKDLWYTYTASCTGTLFVDTCGGVTDDTRIMVYSGTACPPLGAPLQCNDDHGNTTEADTGLPCPSTLESSLSVPCTVGDTFMIRVGTFQATTTVTGADVLNITCAP